MELLIAGDYNFTADASGFVRGLSGTARIFFFFLLKITTAINLLSEYLPIILRFFPRIQSNCTVRYRPNVWKHSHFHLTQRFYYKYLQLNRYRYDKLQQKQ